MHYLTRLIYLLLVVPLPMAAQLSQGGKPLVFPNKTEISIPVINVPGQEQQKLQLEDPSKIDNKKSQIFAVNYDVLISPDGDGRWLSHSQGYRIWRVCIYSPGASSIGLLFSSFRLNEGVKVFVYNKSKSFILGSFTNANNKISGILPVSHVPGDELVIQLEVPINQQDFGELKIGRVAHGIDPITPDRRFMDEWYGVSGDCNTDINCELGINWQDEKNSCCRIITNGGRRCTGNLINNTAEDGTPYVLTAAHCISTQSEAETAIFYFDYESPTCDGPDGNIYHMISGADLIATGDTLETMYPKGRRDSIDFSLVKMSIAPPDSFNVFFAGWDRGTSPPKYTATIHHPQGDVMKISVDNDPPETSYHVDNYFNDLVEYSHWRILEWDNGTTENGSSGGALFNENKRIVGLLTGGQASCDSSVNDYFTKFDYAWDYYSNALKHLKTWLDPLNTGVSHLDGKKILNHIPLYSQDNVMVYPNPGSGRYTVRLGQAESDEAELLITNLSGQVILSVKLLNQDLYTFDLSDKPSGVYLVRIILPERTVSKKIIHLAVY